MPISPEILAVLASDNPVRAVCLHLDFRTDPRWLHLGHGPLRAGGVDWAGLGGAGEISGLDRAIGGTAPKATFSLSGVDNRHIAVFRSQRSEVRGRKVSVHLQFYDRDRQPVDTLFLIYKGVMDKMSLTKGPSSSTFYVTAEGLFSRRARAPGGTLSDCDQKRLYPDDRGLEMMAQIPNRAIYWPIIVG